MGARSLILVLSRHRSGDSDLIARIYSRFGVLRLLVRDGLEPSGRFHGVFEPFNMMTLDFFQRGEVVIPRDFKELRRYSLLSADYERFIWMSHVCRFVIYNVPFYEPLFFKKVIDFLLTDPSGRLEVLRIKLRLEFIKSAGISPIFLGQKIPRGKVRVRLSDGSLSDEGEVEISSGTLRLLKRLSEEKLGKNLRVNGKTVREAEHLLDSIISYHMR